MLSKIFLTGLTAFFLSGGIAEMSEDCANQQLRVVEAVQPQVVKATVYNQQVIPRIDLPTVEITGKRNTKGLVKATIVDGVIYPSIELSEIVIVPEA